MAVRDRWVPPTLFARRITHRTRHVYDVKFVAITRGRHLLPALVACTLAYSPAANASVIVQLKIVEGEGVVYQTGSRASRGLTVLVTDETGKPVANAAVSFKLPDEGPSGTFSSGLRTEVVTTGADGKATVWGMQWNKAVGPVEIRITAVKDQARAGLVGTQYLSEAIGVKAGGQGVFDAPRKSHAKWILIGAIIAGGAAAGLVFARSRSTPAASTPTTAVSISAPSIIVGSPNP